MFKEVEKQVKVTERPPVAKSQTLPIKRSDIDKLTQVDKSTTEPAGKRTFISYRFLPADHINSIAYVVLDNAPSALSENRNTFPIRVGNEKLPIMGTSLDITELQIPYIEFLGGPGMFPSFNPDVINVLALNQIVSISTHILTISESVVEKFRQLAQVSFIYASKQGNKLAYSVFTSNETYDDALMDELLSREEEILNMYPELNITFRYIPTVLCTDPADVIPENATLTFRR